MNEGGFRHVHHGDLPAFEDGKPVPTVDPVFGDEPTPEPADGGAMLTRVLGLLVDDSPPESIGRRFCLLAYLAKTSGAPKSQRALARKLGVSVSRVNTILGKLRLELRDLYGRGERSTHK